jgi:hypothetical protein
MASRFSVSPTRDYLLRDGEPFFYLADTIWAAFANLDMNDWERYLAYRRWQGFTALQISILPITHDTSMSDDNLDPFLRDAGGNWDFGRLNEAYFDKAVTMVEMAVAQEFVPVLGVLWCNYVPGTRCSAHSPVASAMALADVAPYATYAAQRFKQFDPIFFISGDTQFESPDEESYYMAALQATKAACPDALLTMHLTPNGDLPRNFVDAIDFYMFQSGHHVERQDRPYALAEKFRAYPVKRPIVNAEPPYEGHGRVGSKTRFSAFDVRKASWQSLLSGAKMGVTYGAHGVWSCHRRGMQFLNVQNSFEPFDWDQALLLEGAWDVSYARWLFETYGLFELEPLDVMLNDDPEIRAAMDADETILAIYAPYPFDIQLNMNLDGWHCRRIDLASRRVMTPKIMCGERSLVYMDRFNGDSLLIGEKD